MYPDENETVRQPLYVCIHWQGDALEERIFVKLHAHFLPSQHSLQCVILCCTKVMCCAVINARTYY